MDPRDLSERAFWISFTIMIAAACLAAWVAANWFANWLVQP